MKDTIILHLDWKAFLDVLPDEDLGQWTRAILQYMETGQPPTGMSKAVEVAFYASFERIGRDAERYEAKCAVRREAGRKGGLRSGETRRLYHDEANEAKRSKTKQNEHDPDPVPDPEPDPVLSSSDDNSADADAPETMTTIHSIEAVYAAGIGDLTPVARDGIRDAVLALGDELAAEIMRRCIENGARQWSYCATAYEKAIAQGLRTVEEYRGRHRKASGAVVDRPEPSGRDIFARPPGRARQLKREE